MANAGDDLHPPSISLTDETVVDPIAQFFARLKVRDVLAVERHQFPCLRVASSARGTIVERKTAKPSYLYALIFS